MADLEANLIIRVVDQATQALGEVKKSLGGLNQSIQDNRGEILKFGIAATAAGASILASFGLAVSAAREHIATERQLNAVLASTQGAAGLSASALNDMANSLSQVTAYSRDAVLHAEALLLTFTNIGNQAFPRAIQAAMNVASAFRLDLDSAIRQVGKALNDPITGLTGLTRAGVQFSEEQKKVIKALFSTGQVAEAQKMILDELDRKTAGVAKSIATPVQILQNEMNKLEVEIGSTLIPVLDRLAQAAIPVIQRVTEWIRQNPELTKTIVFITAAAGVLLTLLGSLALAIVAVSTALAAATAALAIVGLTLAAGGALFVAIMGIVSLLVVLAQHWEGLKWMVGNVITAVKNQVTAWVEDIRQLFARLGQYIYDGAIWALDKLKQEFTDFFTWIEQKLKQLPATAASAIGSIIVNPIGAVQSAAQAVGNAAGKAIVGRAEGGTVNEPYTLVGEKGPELVSLPTGSYVHDTKESKAMMGGVTINLTGLVIHKEVDADALLRRIAREVQLARLQAA